MQKPRDGDDDIQDYAWAKDAIEILASQNIISEPRVSNGGDITRAEFVRLVVTAAGLQPDENRPVACSQRECGGLVRTASAAPAKTSF